MAKTTSPGADASAKTSALGVPAFRYLWLNSLSFFLVGNGLRFVYGWVVLDGLERGEAWQGFVVFVLGVPSFFLLIPSGVWADRLDPKRMLIATQIALCAVMAGTAFALGSGSGSLTLLVVSATLAGSATALGGPVRSALIPLLLDGDLLYGGIALNAIAITFSLVLGAVTAKLAGDRFGFDGAFWYLAVLTIAGIVVVLPMRSPRRSTTRDRDTMRQAMGKGLSFVWSQRSIRTLFLLLSISGLIVVPIMFVTVQAHIKEELGRSAGDAAPVFALMGVGIAITSVFIMRRGSMANKSVAFMRSMMLVGVTLIVVGFSTEYWQVLALALVIGLCGGFFINMNQALIQSNTPPEVMGRVMGLYALVQVGMTPLGALILGFSASAIGTGATISIGAAIGFTIVVLVYVMSSSIREIN